MTFPKNAGFLKIIFGWEPSILLKNQSILTTNYKMGHNKNTLGQETSTNPVSFGSRY